MKTVLDVLHVLTAVFLVGPMAVLPMTGMRLIRSGATSQVGANAKSTNVFSLASLLVVIFGFGVMGMSEEKYDLSISTPWILISRIAYLVALGINLGLSDLLHGRYLVLRRGRRNVAGVVVRG